MGLFKSIGKAVGSIFKKKPGGTKVGNAIRGIFGGRGNKKEAAPAPDTHESEGWLADKPAVTNTGVVNPNAIISVPKAGTGGSATVQPIEEAASSGSLFGNILKGGLSGALSGASAAAIDQPQVQDLAKEALWQKIKPYAVTVGVLAGSAGAVYALYRIIKKK